jgi:putative phosphoesterase
MSGRKPGDSPLPDPDYCLYGAGTFLPLLMQLETELAGVVRDDDIEYVHRCRVATRRIRAAFSLFPECFPDRRQKKWEKEIRRLTRSLGDARDLDVQVEFVRSILANRIPGKTTGLPLFSPVEEKSQSLSPAQTTAVLVMDDESRGDSSRSLRSRIRFWVKDRPFLTGRTEQPDDKTRDEPNPQKPGAIFSPSDPVIPGLECLLLRLVQRRQVMQPEVARVAGDCSGSGMIEDFARYLHDLKVRAMLQGNGVHSLYSYERAFTQIMVRIADLFWFEPYLSDPSLIHQHHAMRIAAKRLRYTLEAYAGLFDDRVKEELKVIKKIQEILGDMHDCDVWIEFLSRFLDEEEERSRAYFGNTRFFDLVRPGILFLIKDRKENRGVLFENLCLYWDQLKEKGFWDKMSEKISIPMQNSFTGEIGTARSGPITIGLISDVHANLPALEAVLADAESRGAVVMLNAGDSTGYGPFPDEVANLLRSRHILSVVGNYDLSVLSKKWKNDRPRSREKQVAMRWAYHNLSLENRAWLKSLPREIRLSVRGLTLLVTHGSPDSITEYLDDGTPESRLREVASGVGARVVVTGHSHRPAAREVDGVWFVNSGSVGRSEDGDPRACYALITVDPFSLTHIRVPYDIERTVAAIRHRHLPDAFAWIVQEGRSLEMVRDRDTYS